MTTAISSSTNPVLQDETCLINDELSKLKLRGGPNETAIQFEPF